MGRTGKTIISHSHKPTKASAMCFQWWKQPRDGWKHILCPMSPPGTLSWALKSKSYERIESDNRTHFRNNIIDTWAKEHGIEWGTLLTHIEPAVNQHPQVPFCRAALQPLLSQSILVPGITPCQMQNPAFIPLQGLLSLERVNSTSQIGIISKLADGAFNSCLHIIDKNIEQNWP
ncbi:hypothetical protein QYF61_027589 [Mycteria americana]|uniref:Uncharacterized protein n=1 Tax=Mycteria americana TaxID=33587 RepID=A0AAN7N9Q3_MYCAM|nr:hypothetical protein QYF61_027589 [Mycteria americana]